MHVGWRRPVACRSQGPKANASWPSVCGVAAIGGGRAPKACRAKAWAIWRAVSATAVMRILRCAQRGHTERSASNTRRSHHAQCFLPAGCCGSARATSAGLWPAGSNSDSCALHSSGSSAGVRERLDTTSDVKHQRNAGVKYEIPVLGSVWVGFCNYGCS